MFTITLAGSSRVPKAEYVTPLFVMLPKTELG
jgi:hypothetical protein